MSNPPPKNWEARFLRDPPWEAHVDVEIDIERECGAYMEETIERIKMILWKSNCRGLPVTQKSNKGTAIILLKKGSRKIFLSIRKDSGYLRFFVLDNTDRVQDNLCFLFPQTLPIDRPFDRPYQRLPFSEKYTGMKNQARLRELAHLRLEDGMLSKAFENLFSHNKYTKEFALALITILVVLIETTRNDPIKQRVIERYKKPGILGLDVVHFIHIWGDNSRFFNYWIHKREKVCNETKSASRIKNRISMIEEVTGILKSTGPLNESWERSFWRRFREETLLWWTPLHKFFRETKLPQAFDYKNENFKEAEEVFEDERVCGTDLDHYDCASGRFWVIARKIPIGFPWRDFLKRIECFGEIAYGEKFDGMLYGMPFAFFLFKDFDSMGRALRASPIIINKTRVFIEERRRGGDPPPSEECTWRARFGLLTA